MKKILIINSIKQTLNSIMKTKFRRNLFTALVALFAVTIGTSSFAQQQQTSNESDITPKFGVKGGINLTNLYVDDVEDENMRVGFNVGLYGKLPIARGLSIQPEVLYTTKGAQLTYNNILGSGKYKFNLNYVEVPVMLAINLTQNFHLNVGGYAAYLTNANVKHVNGNGDVTGTQDLNADKFNRFDYGVVGGLGVDIENFTIGA